MSGLMVAASLPEYGHRISLVDKGRSAGGRLATRRFGTARADHGAQFFTARSEEFRSWVDRWEAEGLVFVWSHGWSNGSLDRAPDDGHPRYAVREGMNALAKRLAAESSRSGAAVHTGVKLQAVAPTETGWWSCSDDGRVYTGHALVLTCPVPQALALLKEGSVTLTASDQAALEAISYAPCLCLMVPVQGAPALPEPGALQRPGSTAAWVADNQRKGICGAGAGGETGTTVLTVHGSPEFSAAHYEASDADVAAALLAEIEPLLRGSTVGEVTVKRWRYALPTFLHPHRFLRAAGLPPLFFAGDAFGGPRIEGAALSGMAVAGALREILD
jgi:predicted NAD/FAD-dependent oxidoreductase